MVLRKKLSKHALTDFGEPITEQEHADSCNINIMMRNIIRGMDVRGSSKKLQYGQDDLNIDGLSHRIQKDKIKRDLEKTFAENEFTEEEQKLIPDQVKKQFKIKTKKPQINDKKTELSSPDLKSPNQPPPDPALRAPAGALPPSGGPS